MSHVIDQPRTEPTYPEAAAEAAAQPTAEPAAEPTPDGRIWPEGATAEFQERWREVQLRFVDDPRAAAEEAAALAGEVLERFTAAVSERQRQLDTWRNNAEQADTEQMRTTVRNYRHLIDRLFEV